MEEISNSDSDQSSSEDTPAVPVHSTDRRVSPQRSNVLRASMDKDTAQKVIYSYLV